MDNKKVFIDLLKSTKRSNINELIAYLENSDFFEAPASSKYHLTVEGGLLIHSLNVYYNLIKMCGNEYPESTLIIVSLLHDICKANTYKKSIKNVKNENGKWVASQTYVIDELLSLGHGEKSVMIIQKYMNLSVDEMIAIRWHMGFSEPKENYKYVSQSFNKSKLAVFLHMADLKATYIDEALNV